MRIQPIFIGFALLIGGVIEAYAAAPEDSVVRVYATIRVPNPVRPWAKQNPVELMGTGVIVDGKTILTNAHLLLYADDVTVQGRQGGDRFEGKVATVGPGIDLATVTVNESKFFETRPPMPRAAQRPSSNVGVVVYGFSVGGSGLAVTRGIVSRVEYAEYNDIVEGMRIQVDAAVNPGSSGGPALVDGRMIGLTFGQLGRAENVGYVIPNEEIDAYLDDVKDGRYDGKLRTSDRYQVLENEALRARLGLAKSVRGIMVNRPGRSDSTYPLCEGDVITRIGDAALDNEGMVDYEENLRLPFTSLIPRLAKEGILPVTLVRDGKSLEIGLSLSREDDRLIKPYRGQYPPFFVYGPLVFSPVFEEVVPYYIQGNPIALAGSPLLSRAGDRAAFPGEELVVVTAPLLAHKIAKGYGNSFGQVVSHVDGVRVKNLHHLVEMLQQGQGEFVTFRFFGELSETMVFRRGAIEEATDQVMSENGIPRRGSGDVMAIWNKVAPMPR
ncbi:trypsin-like peptidase domain-containing protein [Singulisphaera sp. Ch08]|uniref:Trypsin-like peptidase domain-containing protein n=1 Tax=Singulisphaera sp. Ch08 TaxID=3120278 RepID=A0AAU7CFC0_9BACT